MKQPKINEATRNQLFSTNSETVISAIKSLQESGNSSYLPILFELLSAQPESEVKAEILKLLGMVKDKETIPVFIDVLQNEKFHLIRKDITTVCWQNGLDFSAYFEVFTNLVINEEWEVAFEAFTVIENLETFPSEEQLKPIKLKIARALKSAGEQKQYFLEELLKMSS
ncbi:HEAT repeat domain-containing protein [Maribellus sediminis]|uniref:HEAT repeat domain-containing protein n=1 Tax=Maribellus sediminis TaxID=2696285 RepID=UPI001430CC78|nr:HEAT repeat domain-containing protein [Maribellus sediminis]